VDTMTEQKDIAFENTQVLFLVQALIGNMTVNMKSVAFKCFRASIEIVFVLYHEDPECREGIEDIMFEFEALQLSNISVSSRVIIDDRAIAEEESTLDGRIVFLRKD
jgi:hypothetical protein